MDVFASDFGRTLGYRTNTDGPSFHRYNFAESPEVQGAIDGLGALSPRFGPMRYVITRVKTPEWKDKTERWWDANKCPQRTKGVLRSHIHCVESREEKVVKCRLLKVTHYIDNKLEGLIPLVGTVPHLFHLCDGCKKDSTLYRILTEKYGMICVPNWEVAVQAILVN